MYKGIGEVQQLAGSVSDIKKVFTNVKLRGTWGEVQLSALLEQMLSPNQYRANVRINPLDNAVVEFAVLLPSREDETVYLPVDSKFPVEEYQRLIDAGRRHEQGSGGQGAEKSGTRPQIAGGHYREKVYSAARSPRTSPSCSCRWKGCTPKR